MKAPILRYYYWNGVAYVALFQVGRKATEITLDKDGRVLGMADPNRYAKRKIQMKRAFVDEWRHHVATGLHPSFPSPGDGVRYESRAGGGLEAHAYVESEQGLHPDVVPSPQVVSKATKSGQAVINVAGYVADLVEELASTESVIGWNDGDSAQDQPIYDPHMWASAVDEEGYGWVTVRPSANSSTDYPKVLKWLVDHADMSRTPWVEVHF